MDNNGNDGLMLWCRRTVGGRNDGYVDSQTARRAFGAALARWEEADALNCA